MRRLPAGSATGAGTLWQCQGPLRVECAHAAGSTAVLLYSYAGSWPRRNRSWSYLPRQLAGSSGSSATASSPACTPRRWPPWRPSGVRGTRLKGAAWHCLHRSPSGAPAAARTQGLSPACPNRLPANPALPRLPPTGACPAGGCCLAMCCDYRLMTEAGNIGRCHVQGWPRRWLVGKPVAGERGLHC